MKKFLALFLALTVCAQLFACRAEESGAAAEDTTSAQGTPTVELELPEKWAPEEKPPIDDSGESSVTPLLYKVTDEEGNIAWLFGSIHVGREDLYPLPDYVVNAFSSADALAVEFDIVAFEEDEEAMVDVATLMIYDDGSVVSDHVSEETYTAALEILKENNSYFRYYDYFLAGFWADIIDSIIYEEVGIYDMPDGIDEYLIGKAYEADKPVLNVESAEYQYGMVASYSEALQEELLMGAIEGYREFDYDTYLAELNEMLDMWALGDAEAFAEFLSEDVEFESEQERLLYEEYNYAMLTVRNLNMADYAEQALASGEEVFICVGAAHIVGEGALVDLLTERGYIVEQVK